MVSFKREQQDIFSHSWSSVEVLPSRLGYKVLGTCILFAFIATAAAGFVFGSRLGYQAWAVKLGHEGTPDPLYGRTPIEWLHVPKTGTSFGNTILLTVCTDLPVMLLLDDKGLRVNLTLSCLGKFRPYPDSPMVRNLKSRWFLGRHESLVNRTDEELGRVVTVLRAPRRRLASGYHYVVDRLRDFNLLDPDARVPMSEEHICNFASKTALAHAGMGASTKMIAGVGLHKGSVSDLGFFSKLIDADSPMTSELGFLAHLLPPGPASPAQAREACRRVKLFMFVGITEFWEASVCLYHAMFGGVVRPDIEYTNVRRGRVTEEVDCGDEADEQLYGCAVEWFREHLELHPQCKEHSHPQEAGFS